MLWKCIKTAHTLNCQHVHVESTVHRCHTEPYQFNFMLPGPDRPKFWQMSFNNDNLCRLTPELAWEAESPPNTISQCSRTRSSLVMRQSLLLTSKYESKYDITLQTNAFIASNETVSATHFQITMFIASDESVLWHLALETNAFRVGDEHVSTWDWSARSIVSHAQMATRNHVTIIMIIKPTYRPCL